MRTMWDKASWDEELTSMRLDIRPELPEDILFHMLKLNPKLEKLIKEFDLELEY